MTLTPTGIFYLGVPLLVSYLAECRLELSISRLLRWTEIKTMLEKCLEVNTLFQTMPFEILLTQKRI